MFYLVQPCVLKTDGCSGFAGVFCLGKYAPSVWIWISIPNPCVYPSLSFTSALCCFTVQQLFGIKHQTSTHTLMLHPDLIPISNWGTFLQLVKCALALDPDRGSCLRVKKKSFFLPTKSSIHYSVGVHMVGDVIMELIAFLL